MASTYSDLKFELIGTGEQSGTWGTTTNTNLGTAIEEAITGSADVTFSSGDVTLTLTNTNASQTARNLRLNLTGTSGGAQDLVVPAIEKFYIVNNGCADTITVKNSTGTGVAVPAGKAMLVFNNGTNVVDAVNHFNTASVGTLTLTNALAVAQGGTGSTTASGARTNLGSTATGDALFTAASATAGRTTLGAGAVGDNLFTAATAAAAQQAMDTEVGVDVQAYDAQLDDIAGLTPTDSNFIVGNGSNFVTESGATARNSLSLGTSNDVQFDSFGVGTAASGTTGEIRATNNITAYYSSDKKFKENVQDIDNALNKVDAIGGKTFDWTDDYIKEHGGEDGYFIQRHDIGVIAQDVKEVMPEAVRERSDGSLAVDYPKLVSLAFAAIKELKQEVDELKRS
jgi:hypothetical protein